MNQEDYSKLCGKYYLFIILYYEFCHISPKQFWEHFYVVLKVEKVATQYLYNFKLKYLLNTFYLTFNP